MEARSFLATSVGAAEVHLEAIYEEGFKATLALVFAATGLPQLELSSVFEKRGIVVFGASSGAEFVDNEVSSESASVMLLDISPDHFKLYFASDSQTGDRDNNNHLLAEFAKSAFTNPSVMVMSSGMSSDGQAIVQTLCDALPVGTPIVGGLAADDLRLEETFVFTTEKIHSSGLIALIFNADHIQVTSRAVSGWRPIGVEKYVTKSTGNVVFEIDGKPAVSVFKDYLGKEALEDGPSAIGTIGVYYPLHVYQDDDSPVIRAPLIGSEEDGSITFAGGVSEGSKVRFSLAPGFELIDETVKEVLQLRREAPEPDAIVVFNCMARLTALGPLISDEVSSLYDSWKKPLVGLFTYGEIGAMRGRACQFHNESMVAVLLTEV